MPTCKTLVSALLCALYAILFAPSLEGGGVMRNLAIRGAMLGASGGGVPTARDYDQNGLIVSLNAVENDGYGIHNGSLNGWRNLVDGNLYSATNATWKSDAIVLNSSRTANVTIPKSITPYRDFSIEIVMSITSTTQYGRPLGCDELDASKKVMSIIGNNGTTSMGHPSFQYGSYAGLSRSTSLRFGDRFSQGLVLGSTCVQYINGVFDYQVTGVTPPSASVNWYLAYKNNLRYVSMECCAFRVYNKRITDDVRANNYAVDMAIFGLPG